MRKVINILMSWVIWVISFTNSRESWLLIQGYSAVIHTPVHLDSLCFMAYASVHLHGCAYMCAHTHTQCKGERAIVYKTIGVGSLATMGCEFIEALTFSMSQITCQTKRLWRQGHPNGRCYAYSKDMIMAWQALMGCCRLWESEKPGKIHLIYRYLIHPFFSFIYCLITLGWPEGAAVRKVNWLGIIISLEQIGKRCTDELYANKFTVRRQGHLEHLTCMSTQEENRNIFILRSNRGVQSFTRRSMFMQS